jgi:hypothetical protein
MSQAEMIIDLFYFCVAVMPCRSPVKAAHLRGRLHVPAG